jgi:hypothetical protein
MPILSRLLSSSHLLARRRETHERHVDNFQRSGTTVTGGPFNKPGGNVYCTGKWHGTADGGAQPSRLRPPLLFRSMQCDETSLFIHGRRAKDLTTIPLVSYMCNGCTRYKQTGQSTGRSCPDLRWCAGSGASWAGLLPSLYLDTRYPLCCVRAIALLYKRRWFSFDIVKQSSFSFRHLSLQILHYSY